MKDRILNLLRAGFPILYVVSHEEQRVEATLREVTEAINQRDPAGNKFTLSSWSCTEGLLNTHTGKLNKDLCDPNDVLNHFVQDKPQNVYVLRDFHVFTEGQNFVLWRRLKDAAMTGKASSKAIIIVGCRYVLPPELEKEVTLVDFSLPSKVQLRKVLDALTSGNNHIQSDDPDEIVTAAKGMTTIEAENAFALSYVEKGRICKDVVFREKCLAVKKSGILEVVDSNVQLADIGGLERLKKWLLRRKRAFGEEAKKYGFKRAPRGFLAVGQPGTGKSLTAKACKSILGLPLLRLDAARLFGSLVGQSEGNWRSVHALALAMAPCIFWIDEVDGAMSGHSSSGQTDGGTTSRVIKSILQDMEENSEGIFYVLTANDVDNLPSPLLRRVDEVWNVELPNPVERAAIWNIKIAEAARKAAEFSVAKLVELSDGFSGAEIEKLIVQAQCVGFDENRPFTTDDISTVCKEFSPLSQTMASDIERRRKRLAGVAKLASEPLNEDAPAATPVTPPTRKIAFGKPVAAFPKANNNN